MLLAMIKKVNLHALFDAVLQALRGTTISPRFFFTDIQN